MVTPSHSPAVPARTRALLREEVTIVQAFLDCFEPPSGGGQRRAQVDDTGTHLTVKNFPLPDQFSPITSTCWCPSQISRHGPRPACTASTEIATW